MKVLIIDDDETGRRPLSELLSDAGYDVLSAEDGNAGLRLMREERPALVISDILMPVMDGFQLLREIRGDPALRDTPVLFYTGTYLEEGDRELARQIGVTKYFTKPFELQDLLHTVRELLHGPPALPPNVSAPIHEPVFLKRYNERLVQKLKTKIIESEHWRLFLSHIMEGMGDGVTVIDRDLTILHANAAAAASLGLEPSEMIGQKCYEVIHRRRTTCEEPHIICPGHAVFEKGETIKLLHTHFDGEGNEQYIEITASPVKDGRGKTIAMVETFRNVMDKTMDTALVNLVKRLNETQTSLKHMAITDELTGLRNRRYIVERLEEEFQRAKRSHRPLSLIMLDIDHFKRINDAHGHLFGDIVLRVVAARIKASLRKSDLVGRVGGEEFLVISYDSALDDTVVVAERIIGNMDAEMVCDGVQSAKVALSAGVTMMTETDASADMLFSRADAALYKAKEGGRNRVMSL